ncbi:MAG: hypothetical protein MUF16_16580 [Burkholderiaceae bacterium]|nr:hypothetical protein [Burkholderiaceae bacterium]
MSAQELTYPQKPCCSATPQRAAARPSGFALMVSKYLILLSTKGCREMGQGSQMLAKSRAWALPAQFAHKVIHKMCGQRQKRFSIIDLGVLSQMNPSFLAQLDLSAR